MSLTLSPQTAPPLLVPLSVNGTTTANHPVGTARAPDSGLHDLSLFIHHIHSHKPFCEVCCLNIPQFSSVLSWLRPSAYLKYSSGLLRLPLSGCHPLSRCSQIAPSLVSHSSASPTALRKRCSSYATSPGSLHPFPLDQVPLRCICKYPVSPQPHTQHTSLILLVDPCYTVSFASLGTMYMPAHCSSNA